MSEFELECVSMEPRGEPPRAAVVTGASSGIGLEISKTLLRMGYRVYGLARNFAKTAFAHERFVPIVCDLRKPGQIAQAVERVRQAGFPVGVLVNNAGIGYFGPHEQIKPAQIEEMIALNLQAPLVLTQMMLRDLKKNAGYVINISSVTALKTSTHGCAYAATKAGLSHFGRSLFEEIRKTGAKVVTIHPDITKTPFYDRLDFKEGEAEDSYITAQCVAEAVRTVLTQRSGTVVTEMTIRPQRQQITRKRGGSD